jgi:hypothetical protein
MLYLFGSRLEGRQIRIEICPENAKRIQLNPKKGGCRRSAGSRNQHGRQDLLVKTHGQNILNQYASCLTTITEFLRALRYPRRSVVQGKQWVHSLALLLTKKQIFKVWFGEVSSEFLVPYCHTKAINTVLAFVSSKRQLATSFSAVRSSVEGLLKQWFIDIPHYHALIEYLDPSKYLRCPRSSQWRILPHVPG